MEKHLVDIGCHYTFNNATNPNDIDNGKTVVVISEDSWPQDSGKFDFEVQVANNPAARILCYASELS